MSATPAISVVMSAFNAQSYLREAVGSVLSQTCTDFELILIDDGSTDQTLAISKELAASDSRLRLVSRENAGMANSLNEGISIARAALIARMDADDIAEPLRLERQMALLSRRPEVVAIGTQGLWIDGDGLPFGHTTFPVGHKAIDYENLHGLNSMAHPSVLMRRDAIDAVGGYRAAFEGSEDLDLWLRLAERGGLANLPQHLMQLRWHGRNHTVQERASQGEHARRARREAYERRGIAPPRSLKEPRHTGRTSRKHIARRIVRQAARQGYPKAARKWARISLRDEPLNPRHWFLLLLAATSLPRRHPWEAANQTIRRADTQDHA